MSDSVALNGLRADVPLGFMAAMGLWRILSSSGGGLAGVKMRWVERRGAFTPVLEGEGVTGDGVIAACLSHLEVWPERSLFQSRESVKGAVNRELRDWRGQLPGFLDWFAALCVEASADDEKIETTPLDMSFARQKFLADTIKLQGDLLKNRGKKGPSPADTFREALIGPWRYRDDCHSRGWDAATLKEAAFTFQEPSPMPNGGVSAAVWLAVHSLPCFPCYVDRGRLRPRGFAIQDGALVFTWPVWQPALSLTAALTILGQTARCAAGGATDQLRARGVSAIYSSERRKLTKYMVSLLAPERIL